MIKKIFLLLLLVATMRYVSVAQCTLSVYIDSNIVKPCSYFIPSPDTSGGGGSCGCANQVWAVVSGGTPPYSYAWSPVPVNDDSTSYILMHACYTTYSVVVTDANGCSVTASIVINMPANGIQKEKTGTQIKIYPVPVSDKLIVETSFPNDCVLEICDLTGKSVTRQEQNSSSGNYIIDVSGLEKGCYYLRLTAGDTQRFLRFARE